MTRKNENGGMSRISTILLISMMALCLPTLSRAQAWDSATCYDICNIVYNDGYNLDDVLQGKLGYELCNNIDVEDGFMSLYYKNCDVDAYGNLNGLSRQGVSSVIMVHVTNGPVEMSFSVFNAANAQKFLKQATDLGFTKLSRIGGRQKYLLENIVMEDLGTDKIGRFTSYSFKFSKGF